MRARSADATRARPPEALRPRPSEAVRLLGLLNALGSTTFRRLLWEKASLLELTFAQSQVLFYVARHPRRPMGAVARALGVTLPAVTHVVDRLEHKRFVLRRPEPSDRRVAVLELTAAGRALVAELEDLRLGALERLLARMSLADRRRVLVGLEKLVGAAAAAPTNGSRGRRRARRIVHG